jgi:AcrR family transcriptional regulator
MGRKPMTPDARAKMRDRILDGANALLALDGINGLSMRSIAKEIGTSSMTLYLYFDDRNDIIQHLAKEGFELLFEELESIKKPIELAEQCEQLALIYVNFAKTHKCLFELMYSNTIDSENSLRQAGANRVLNSFNHIVGDSAIGGAFWAVVHGSTVLNGLNLSAPEVTTFISQKVSQFVAANRIGALKIIPSS